jgi:hypothetical protein
MLKVAEVDWSTTQTTCTSPHEDSCGDVFDHLISSIVGDYLLVTLLNLCGLSHAAQCSGNSRSTAITNLNKPSPEICSSAVAGHANLPYLC